MANPISCKELSALGLRGKQADPLIVADGSSFDLRPLLAGARLPLIRITDHEDPLAAITNHLANLGGQAPRTLHIVAHGRPGAIRLANRWIDREALQQAAAGLATWPVDRIVVWSCQTGSDPYFITVLAELTGAQVTASTGVTNASTTLQLSRSDQQATCLLDLFNRASLTAWNGELLDEYDATGKQFNFDFANPLNTTIVANRSYRYDTVVTVKDMFGADVKIDAVVSINSLTRATLDVFDSSSFQYNTTQLPLAGSFLQPNLYITAYDGISKGGFADFNIQFVKRGTNELVLLKNVKVDFYDIDGNGSSITLQSARQYVEIDTLGGYVLASGSLLDIVDAPDGSGIRFQIHPVHRQYPAMSLRQIGRAHV